MDLVSQIGTWVVSAGGGALLLSYAVKIVLSAMNLAAKKIPVKLTSDQMEQLSDKVAEKAAAQLSAGIDVNMGDELDKHATKRVVECENMINAFSGKLDATDKVLVKIGKVVSDLKSPSASFTDDLKAYISEFESSDSLIPVIENKVKTRAKIEHTAKHTDTSDKY